MSWAVVPLGDLIEDIAAGRSFGALNAPAVEGHWGIIKVSAMTSGKFRPDENKAVPAKLADPRFEIRQGDLLVSRANTSEYVGASVLVRSVRPKLLLSDKSLRLTVKPAVDPEWLWYMLQAPSVRSQIRELATGTKDSMRNISQAALRRIQIPSMPTDEQRRIVKILEDHLSRLDAAGDYLSASARRLEAMVTAILLKLIPNPDEYPSNWRASTVAEAGRVELGRQRHPDWHSGPNMRPYLRVANVFEDRIDTRDVMEMHWPEGVFDRFKLQPGDVLLNEGQTPELLGRPALYRGDPPDVAFTNSILRFKAGDAVMPEFAVLVFRRHMRAGRFKRESRITTNIAHLSAARLKPIEFPIPPLREQKAIVNTAAAELEAVARLRSEIEAARAKRLQLRRSLLTKAFNGWLVSP
ncbi:hypothetical protein ACXDF8_14105 [Mycolicibacterium sp. CBM1]